MRVIQPDALFGSITARQEAQLGSVLHGVSTGSEHTCPKCHAQSYMAGRKGACPACTPKPAPKPAPAKKSKPKRTPLKYRSLSVIDRATIATLAYLGSKELGRMLGVTPKRIDRYAAKNGITLGDTPRETGAQA